MKTWLMVVRYHLLKSGQYLLLPWAWTAFGFAVDLVIFALVPAHHNSSGRNAAGLVAMVIVYFVLGVISIAQELPFALTLGVSRRSYYAGTALLGVGLAVLNGLGITGFQAIERGTGGWGESAHIFQVPYILSGPWYLTWLTASVTLALLFGWGMWFGIVYRRWSLPGGLVFAAAQITVLLVAAVAITWTHSWPGTGHFFSALSATGLTGLFAALTAALLAGGYATMRRTTV
jgi:hypothetical protein